METFGPEDWDSWLNEGNVGNEWIRRLKKSETDPLFDYQKINFKSDILRDIDFIRELGAGNYGRVFEVSAQLKIKDEPYTDPVWKRFSFACKLIQHETDDRDDIEMSLIEMRTLRYLRHKNICNFVEIIGIPDTRTGFPFSLVCLFFELCNGNLRALVNQIKDQGSTGKWVLPEQFSRHWFAQISRALDYIHGEGFLHEDIHAENILWRYGTAVNRDNYQDQFLYVTFKLTDFGQSIDLTLIKTAPQVRQTKINFDIKTLASVLAQYGVPPTFHGVSPAMLDLIDRMRSSTITTQQILLHEWLQSNTEPLTEPYILKEINFEVQPSYNIWEDVREHPELLVGYSPFGRVHKWEFDRGTQEWISSYDAVEGAANKL